MENVLTQASAQWANRPDDQRFLTLTDLAESVGNRKRESWTATPAVSDLRVQPIETDRGIPAVGVELYDPTHGQRRTVQPSHWGFGQLATYAQAPAAYLRRLPAELACINLQWGLERNPVRDDALILGQSNGSHTLRAITSTSYGRIWDSQVVSAVQKMNADDRWVVPAASYSATNPKRATTLYASDRDVFVFLVDPKNPIQVGSEILYRGFFTWNSEVGAATYGLTTFLYRVICDNRIVWGATQVNELRIRHTGGAPERFAYEGARYLARYADESTTGLIAGVKAAQAAEIPDSDKRENVETWLQKRGFSKTVAKGSVDSAVAEEGRARTVWDIVNGITAYARTISHTDERVAIETAAGKIMQSVAA